MKEEKKADHDPDLLKERAQRLGLFGLLAHFDEFCREPWLPKLLQYEQAERDRRSLVRRIKSAKLGNSPFVQFLVVNSIQKAFKLNWQ